jgi:D-threo-aldose 1-dehydrogenase
MTLPVTRLGSTGVTLTLTRAGVGCAARAGRYLRCSDSQGQAALQAAWDGGIRYLDTWPFCAAGVAAHGPGCFLAGKRRCSFTN